MQLKFSQFFIILLLNFTYSSANAEILFSDSFESGDFSTSAAEVNTINLAYTYNRTGVVTQIGDESSMTYPSSFTRSDIQDWTAKTGSHSMLFDHAAGVNMAEQRFNFNPLQDEIWLQYWIRVPVNYSHGTGGGGASNNKFLALWMDGYIQEGTGSTVVLSMENAGSGNTDLAFTYTQANGEATAFQQHVPFINIETDRGKWMQMVVHLKFGTTNGSDSTLETWRKWEDESSFTQLHQTSTANMTKGSSNGWGGGYFMGWVNGTYAEDTWWLIDDILISDTSLLDTSDTSLATPPTNFTGEAQ